MFENAEEVVIYFQIGGILLCFNKSIICVKQLCVWLCSCEMMVVFIRKLISHECKALLGQHGNFEAWKEELTHLGKMQWQRGDAVSFFGSHIWRVRLEVHYLDGGLQKTHLHSWYNWHREEDNLPALQHLDCNKIMLFSTYCRITLRKGLL